MKYFVVGTFLPSGSDHSSTEQLVIHHFPRERMQVFKDEASASVHISNLLKSQKSESGQYPLFTIEADETRVAKSDEGSFLSPKDAREHASIKSVILDGAKLECPKLQTDHSFIKLKPSIGAMKSSFRKETYEPMRMFSKEHKKETGSLVEEKKQAPTPGGYGSFE